MIVGSCKALAIVFASLIAASTLATPTQAQDFFSSFFGGFGRPRPPVIQIPFGGSVPQAQPRQRYGGGQAFCVRTCDGRHFPVVGDDNKSRAATCKSLCPSAETRIVYGSSIDEASTESGKSYSDLPNAFRYRKELVADCTCNGKDAMGLAQVKIEHDPTLRKGDIVAGNDGLVVADRDADRGGAVHFSPASARVNAKYRSPPTVAKGR